MSIVGVERMRPVAWVWVVLLAVCGSALAAEPRVVSQVESQVSLRRWDAKGAGEIIGTELLSVVLAPNEKGDVVILTWDAERTSFTAEVYRPLPAVNELREWEALGGALAKKLSEQPGGAYAIQYTRPGPEGGLVSQRFRLSGGN